MEPPQIIHFNRVFHSKPSILGYPYFWKHPHINFPGYKEEHFFLCQWRSRFYQPTLANFQVVPCNTHPCGDCVDGKWSASQGEVLT